MILFRQPGGVVLFSDIFKCFIQCPMVITSIFYSFRQFSLRWRVIVFKSDLIALQACAYSFSVLQTLFLQCRYSKKTFRWYISFFSHELFFLSPDACWCSEISEDPSPRQKKTFNIRECFMNSLAVSKFEYVLWLHWLRLHNIYLCVMTSFSDPHTFIFTTFT